MDSEAERQRDEYKRWLAFLISSINGEPFTGDPDWLAVHAANNRLCTLNMEVAVLRLELKDAQGNRE